MILPRCIAIILASTSFASAAQSLNDYEAGSRQPELVAAQWDIPGISQQWTERGKMIWALEEYKGRIYIGYGDYGANTGPMAIVSYRGNGFVHEATLNTEATEDITATNGHLYVSYTDHHHGLSPGTFAWQDQWSDKWTSANHFSDALHAYEVASQNGRVYIATGGYTAQIRSTVDNGNSWTTELAIDPNGEVSRFYHVGANSDTVFASGVTWDGYRLLNYAKKGGSWYEVKNANYTLKPISLNDDLKLLHGPGFVRLEGDTVVHHSNLPHNSSGWPNFNVSKPDNLFPFEVLFLIQSVGDGRKEIFATTDFVNWTPAFSLAEQEQTGMVDVVKTVRRLAYYDNNLYMGTSDGHLYRLNDLFRYAPNQAPVADAGSAREYIDADRDGFVMVHLDGTGSHDADGHIVAYTWYNASRQHVANGEQAQLNLAVGSHELTLEISDEDGSQASSSVLITVLEGENSLPIANAGSDNTWQDENNNGTVEVQLDGSSSRDDDGDIVDYIWQNQAGDILASGIAPIVELAIGRHVITLKVIDNDGDESSDELVIDIVVDEANKDDDDDGIKNGEDNCPTLSNEFQLDMDEDSIGDLCDLDRDGDSFANESDNCPDLFNDEQNDKDNDGLGNACDADIDGDGLGNDIDNCQYIVNPNQWDMDEDGIGNECDADIDGDLCDNNIEEALGTKAWQADSVPAVCEMPSGDDSDGDGVFDSSDNCIDVVNAGQWDKDLDGIGNACDDDLDGDGCNNDIETALGKKMWNPQSTPQDCVMPEGPDSDGDGVVDSADNCPDIVNSGQWDKDRDGLGNECDNDIDGDGCDNEIETALGKKMWNAQSTPQNCVMPEGPDSDGDGVADVADNCPELFNEGQWDKDQDNIGNECDEDIDGDGFSNLDEESAGTNAWNAAAPHPSN